MNSPMNEWHAHPCYLRTSKGMTLRGMR
jgi:hypothetical protein